MKPTSMHVDAAGADFATLLDVLAWRAEHQADQTAYIFLADGETQEIRLSYGELDKKARAIAARLIALDTGRQPVALLYPSGLDFIEAFFGVLYAGAIAVPLYPPRRNRPDERLASVIKDCGARLFLTTRAVVDELPLSTQPASPLHGMRCLTTDDVPAAAAGDFPGVPRQPSATAFLQYTSGSTCTPKGVMVSHRNLMANLERIKQSCGQPDMLVVGWLPMFHDMGLISNTLEPLYVGATLVFMSPVHFLQQPIRWLRAISRYRASTSGGPNFAYELCASKTTAVERAGLDLGRWNVAFNGAEPVRLDTLERFAAAFAPSGFRRSAFFPCYGLAEATILVASGRRGERPVSIGLDASLLLQDRVGAVAGGDDGVRVSVGCGQIADEETVLIVDPQTFSVCAPDRVGEIWVASESVAQGYWNRPAQTLETFGARLAGGDRSFLRTGDLGFVQDKELFITGRLKDLIILRGRNYYPHDIEQTMEQSHPALRHGYGAAFSQERDGEEQLVLVVEVERQHVRRLDVEALCAAVRDSVFLQHEIWPHALYLLKPGGIPKTSSGKIRRRACKEALLDGTLDVLHAWRDGTAAPAPVAPVATAAAQAVRDWLKARVGEYAKRAAAEIDIHKPFAEYGIDSLTAVRLSGELEQHLGRRLAPTLLYDCPTIDLLANSLDAAARAPTPAPLPPPGAGAAEPIAIVGIGCRFPGAAGAAAFWTLLREQTDAITQVPPERWPVDAFYDAAPSVPGKMNTRWGGFLEDIDRFDENFFGISPREAVTMDPQQRLLLETAYEALEDAGLPAAGLKASRTGVFIGICNNDYSALLSGSGGAIDPRWATGNAFSIAANRISYVFDLKGPSLAVDTACSSSLVSVHLACQSLWSGESTLALAGGVNLILKPDVTISFSAAGGTSPDGRCMAFGAQANGMVRSEGVGIVVLKPLSRALADADQIYALIPGSAVNHDGLSNGISAPNQAAQEAVIRAAFQRARRPLDQLQYVEAHGTGTLLGDPIEAHALGQVLPAGRNCAIGSVKSNIGHTEAAAGIASLIKVALALKHGRIPASLHSAVPNPYIPFDQLGLHVQQTEAAWSDQGGPHLAGVSAFGFGGTNAHVVLEQAPAPGVARPAPAPRTAKLLPLSARTPEALHELVRAYLDLLEQPTDALNLDALCHSAALRRDHHACRLGIVFADRDELVERLRAFLAGEMLAGMSYLPRQPGEQPKLAFVFSGHRGQAWSLSRDFLDSEPVFFDVLNQCAQLFQEYADWPLLARLCGEQGGALDPQQLDVYHPCQFAYQVALAALWRAKGVQPAAIVGHSFGEVAAAHVAGALSLADATRIIFLRSRCLRDGAAAAAGHGAMATVEMPRLEVQAILDAEAADVAIAVNNSPTSVVLSGNAASVAKLVASLKARQVFCNILDTPGAGHDQSIDVDALTRALAGIAPTSATLPLASSVLGKMIDGRDMDAAYWARNIRDAVLFADAVGALIDAACDTFIEIAPYPPVLSYAISQCLRHAKREGATLPVLRRNADEQMHLFGALGALYAQGYPLQWDRVYLAPQPFVALPSYPWQRKAFWVPAAAAAAAPAAPPLAPGGHALLKQSRQFAANPGVRFWEIAVDVAAFPFFADHKVQGAIILPTTAYLEMALAAGQQVFGCNNCVLQNLVIRKALFLPERDARTLQLILTAGPEQSAAIQFFSRPQVCADDAAWTLHASIELCRAQDAAAPASDFSAATLALDYPQTISSGEHYKVLTQKGVAYGPAFQGVISLWLRDRETVGAVQLPPAQVNDAYLLHPALLDACLQVLAGQLHENESALQKNDLFLPVGVGSLTVYALPPAGAALWSRALLRSAVTPDMKRVEGDVQILDQAGRVLVEVHGLALERVGFGKALAYQNADACLYEVQWDAVSREHADGASQGLPPTHWVVCGDHLLGPEIARALRGRGESCSLVLAGAEFRRTDAHCFCIDPLAPDHYALLLPRLLDDAGGRAMNILHFWSLLPASAEAGAADWWHGPCESGCLSLLQLLQALAAGQTSQRVNLSVLTRQGQALQGETVAPPQAAVWGLGKVIAFEHPELACSLVDVAADAGLDDVAELLEELRAVQGKALQVALRRHGRYEPRLRRLSLEAGAPLRGKHLPPAVNGRDDETLALRADASYLVTGGLGGIGLGIAQWLCLRGARNLVLLGRSAPSDAAAAAIKVLEAAGARVHVASVDVADPAQLAGVLARIAQTMPPLRGVVHAAAVVDPGLLQNLDAGRFQSVMAPKAGGAWNLHSLTLGLPLDFFVMFSSVASLFGTPGQGNYVAANAFLDGLAHQRRALGLPALSINWGGWSQVGLVARHAGAAEIFALRGFESMTPEQGFAMLEKLLRHALPQVAVMATNWRQVCQTYPQIGNMPFFAALLAAEQTGATSTGKPVSVLSRGELLAMSAQERQHCLQRHLGAHLAKSLGIAAHDIEAARPINTMGIDSLMALEIKNRIESELQVALPIVKFLEGANITEIASVLREEIERDQVVASQPEPPASAAAAALDSVQAAHMLANIDQLSDAEVDALLASIELSEGNA